LLCLLVATALLLAAALPLFAASRSRVRRRAMPPVIWNRLSDNLWRIDDGTVAYLIRSGDKGLMINVGAGRALRDLSPAEVTVLEKVVVTHHLRPVTQGLPAAAAAGAQIAAPVGEVRLLGDAERFWAEAPLRNVYFLKPDRQTPTRNVPIAQELKGGSSFRWHDITFKVVSTPGPTAGAIGLVTEIDGNKIAFTGELIVNDGQIPNYWNMHYVVGDNGLNGLQATRESVKAVMRHDPEWLMPSRGPLIDDPIESAKRLNERIKAVEKLFTAEKLGQGFFGPDEHPLPHLYWRPGSYLLVGKLGHAVLIGHPGVDDNGWGGPEWLADLRKKNVFDTIDMIILLSYQDDHVGGVQAIATTFGCPIYTSREVGQALRSGGPDPFSRFLAQQYEGRLKTRIIETGDHPQAMMKWDRYLLRFLPFGGHSAHQMGLYTVIDGVEILFSGDSILPVDPLIGDFSCFHHVGVPGMTYADAAEWLHNLKPEKAASMRHGLIDLNKKKIEQYRRWAQAIEPTLTPLLASRTYREGVDPYARHEITPFQVTYRPPDQQRIKITCRNVVKGPLNVLYRFDLPDGWRLQTRSRQDRNRFIDTGKVIRAKRRSVTLWTEDVRLIAPPDLSSGRTVIGIDVVDDGRFLGQTLHLIVDHGLTAPAFWTPACKLTPFVFAEKKTDIWSWLPDRLRTRKLWQRAW